MRNWLKKNLFLTLHRSALLTFSFLLFFSSVLLPPEINVSCNEPVVQLHVSDQRDLLPF